MKKTGKSHECSDLAFEYLFTDTNGSRHHSVRTIRGKIIIGYNFVEVSSISSYG